MHSRKLFKLVQFLMLAAISAGAIAQSDDSPGTADHPPGEPLFGILHRWPASARLYRLHSPHRAGREERGRPTRAVGEPDPGR